MGHLNQPCAKCVTYFHHMFCVFTCVPVSCETIATVPALSHCSTGRMGAHLEVGRRLFQYLVSQVGIARLQHCPASAVHMCI